MIKNIKIIVNTETFNKSKYGSITGEIFFKVESAVFPENNWNDFIVVILSQWLMEFKQFVETKSTSFEMNFMDGPLFINVKRKNDKELYLKFSKKYIDDEEVYLSTVCSVDKLNQELVNVAQKILEEVEKRNWVTPDIVALKSIVASCQC